jgi:hypothetical protein
MSTKSRQVIYGGRIIGAKIRAEGAREETKKAVREGAVLAARDVSAQRRRAATFDGAHHFELEQAHVTAVSVVN